IFGSQGGVPVTHLRKMMLEELQGRKSLRLCLTWWNVRWFDPIAEASELPNHSPSAQLLRSFGHGWAAFLVMDSSRRDSSWFCSRIRSHLSWYFLRVTVRHRRCSASGTKLKVNSWATSRFTRRSASGKSLLRPRRPRLDSACAKCNFPDFRLAS